MRRLTREEIELIHTEAGTHRLTRELSDFVALIGIYIPMLAHKKNISQEDAKDCMRLALKVWELTDLRTLQINELGGR